MTKNTLYLIVSILIIFTGAFILSLTIQIQIVHVISMILLVLGGYALNR